MASTTFGTISFSDLKYVLIREVEVQLHKLFLLLLTETFS